jgi:hypothetical protein
VQDEVKVEKQLLIYKNSEGLFVDSLLMLCNLGAKEIIQVAFRGLPREEYFQKYFHKSFNKIF